MLGTQYGLSEFIGNVFNILYTRFFFSGSRLIRRPFYLRGREHFDWGNNLTIGRSCRFDLDGDGITLRFGDNCKLNDRVHIVAHQLVDIGSDVLMASNIFISDSSHGSYTGTSPDAPDIAPDKRPIISNSVKIGDRVWIGENVSVLPGVTVGKGSILGSNSVISHDVPDNCIVAGVPAKVIKRWDSSSKTWIRNTK